MGSFPIDHAEIQDGRRQDRPNKRWKQIII